MSNVTEYKDILAFHPGYYLAETIEEMGYTQEEFAIRLGVTPKTISIIVNGQCNLTRDISEKLAVMLGTSVEVWLNLQKRYEDKKQEIEQARWLEKQSEIARCIDYKYLVKNIGFPSVRNIQEKIKNLCKKLQVADLRIFLAKDFLVNYRNSISNIKKENMINSKVWLQIAINKAKENPIIESFKPKKLDELVPIIRGLTIKEPDVFMSELNKLFTKCGVKFIFLPYLKNSAINGAVKWLDSQHPILAINDRRNYSDTFWFSLFHEIKHLLQQKTKTIFLNGEVEYESFDLKLENEADIYARETLIPCGNYKTFINQANFKESDIVKFAKEIGIHPSIVLGRLQTDKIIPYNKFNKLRTKYRLDFT